VKTGGGLMLALSKAASCLPFATTFATALLNGARDIRTIQELLAIRM